MMKFEIGIIGLKKMALHEYNVTLFGDDLNAYYTDEETEAYFYLNKDGDPVFVIEEHT